MSALTELTLQLKDVLTQIRMADAYESARLSKQAVHLTMQIRREKVLAQHENRSIKVVGSGFTMATGRVHGVEGVLGIKRLEVDPDIVTKRLEVDPAIAAREFEAFLRGQRGTREESIPGEGTEQRPS